jgi:hypothetical protein
MQCGSWSLEGHCEAGVATDVTFTGSEMMPQIAGIDFEIRHAGAKAVAALHAQKRGSAFDIVPESQNKFDSRTIQRRSRSSHKPVHDKDQPPFCPRLE